jgi:hypothetical protein
VAKTVKIIGNAKNLIKCEKCDKIAKNAIKCNKNVKNAIKMQKMQKTCFKSIHRFKK